MNGYWKHQLLLRLQYVENQHCFNCTNISIGAAARAGQAIPVAAVVEPWRAPSTQAHAKQPPGVATAVTEPNLLARHGPRTDAGEHHTP